MGGHKRGNYGSGSKDISLLPASAVNHGGGGSKHHTSRRHRRKRSHSSASSSSSSAERKRSKEMKARKAAERYDPEYRSYLQEKAAAVETEKHKGRCWPQL
mmetsp:Transcript_23148/g.53914  ORF Transcript_23148/g.53914 Transcript_23148/m.53914 type:complete len:101 (+) Transcript_23148:93-395(+)